MRKSARRGGGIASALGVTQQRGSSGSALAGGERVSRRRKPAYIGNLHETYERVNCRFRLPLAACLARQSAAPNFGVVAKSAVVRRADHAALTHGSEPPAAAWALRAAWEPATGRLRFHRGGEAAPRAAAASHGAVRHTGLKPERAETCRATTAHMPPPTCGFARTHMLEPTCRTHMPGMLRLPWWCQSVPTTAAWDARLRVWAAPCTLEARLCRSDLIGSLQCCRERVPALLMSRLSPHRLIGLFNEWDDDGSTITC